jgi:hypothetical protein
MRNAKGCLIAKGMLFFSKSHEVGREFTIDF